MPNEQKLCFKSPDDAPKDGTLILGDFGWPWLCLAVWNPADEEWVVAHLQASMVRGREDFYFENLYESHGSMNRWCEVPELVRPVI